MSVRNTNFFRVILILFIALSSPICFLSGINDFQEVHFKNGKVGNKSIETMVIENPNAIIRHLYGLRFGMMRNSEDSTQKAIVLWAARYGRIKALDEIFKIAKDHTLPSNIPVKLSILDVLSYIDPDTGNTPFHEAVLNNHADTVKVLFENVTPNFYSYFLNLKNKNKKTIKDLEADESIKNYLNSLIIPLEVQVEPLVSKVQEGPVVKEEMDDKNAQRLAEKAQKLGEEKAKIKEEKIDTEKTAGPRLNVTTRPQGFPGRRLPTKKLDVARKLRSEQLQEEMQKRDEEAQEKRKSVIANLKKFKIELDDFVIKNPKKPLTKVSLQALLKQNNLEKYFTELNMLSDSTVTVAKFHEAIDKKIEKLNKKMGIYEAEVILSSGVQKDLSEGLIESKSDGKLEQQLKKLSASLGILRSKLDELRKSLNDLKSHLH